MTTRHIWKYPLESFDCVISMPSGARVLSAQYQNDVICIWVEVDQNLVIVPRRFVTIGTGQRLPENAFAFVSTVQQPPLVWHIYEIFT